MLPKGSATTQLFTACTHQAMLTKALQLQAALLDISSELTAHTMGTLFALSQLLFHAAHLPVQFSN
jgi:hypothetical protein